MPGGLEGGGAERREKSEPQSPLVLAPGSLHPQGIKQGCARVVLAWSLCRLVRSAARRPTQTCPTGAGPPRSAVSGGRAGDSPCSPTAVSRQEGPDQCSGCHPHAFKCLG